jgi:hypothetical protein
MNNNASLSNPEKSSIVDTMDKAIDDTLKNLPENIDKNEVFEEIYDVVDTKKRKLNLSSLDKDTRNLIMITIILLLLGL